MAQGLKIHDSVKCATIENIDLSGYPVIDTYQSVSGDRILVRSQTGYRGNGIYKIDNSGIWTRDPSMDQPSELAGVFVFVTDGSLNKHTGWVCTNDPSSSDLYLTDNVPVYFSQFSQAGLINAGIGLTQTGNRLNVIPDLAINGGIIDNTIIGQTTPAFGKFTQLYLNNIDLSSIIDKVTINDISLNYIDRNITETQTIVGIQSLDIAIIDTSINEIELKNIAQDISINIIDTSISEIE